MTGQPRRRTTDRPTGWIREHWITVVVTLALGGLLYYPFGVVDTTSQQSEQNAARLDAQAQSRRVAIDVLCGIGSGVSHAGALVFSGKLPGLPGPGNPTARQAYIDIVVASVAEEAGVEARGLVLPDGSIDCEELRRRANAVVRRPHGGDRP
jgi:hypothetical protein